MLGVVGSNLTIFKLEPTTVEHVATRRNRVAKRAQHVAPNNVAICCVDMLRSFGRGFKLPTFALTTVAIRHVGAQTNPLNREVVLWKQK